MGQFDKPREMAIVGGWPVLWYVALFDVLASGIALLLLPLPFLAPKRGKGQARFCGILEMGGGPWATHHFRSGVVR